MAKILVIEDDFAFRESITETLADAGFDVMSASDGVEGVRLAKQHIPDLIVSDIRMPKKDGYDLLAEVREEPATALVPFIFLTGQTDRAAMRQGMDLGADDFLTKPFTLEELLNAVHARLERRAMIVEDSNKKIEILRATVSRMLPVELRTPLTTVMACAQMLFEVQGLTAEAVSENAHMIYESAERLQHLIENFLLYARIQTRMHNEAEVALLRQQSRTVRPDYHVQEYAMLRADKHGRRADLQLQLRHVPTARINADDFEKIVSELVDNAFKFSEPGTPVHVSTRRKAGDYVLTITNLGRGMTAEQIANVGAYMQFERKLFGQEGSGLGLIIAQSLTALYEGTLHINSVPKKRTAVTIHLPTA